MAALTRTGPGGLAPIGDASLETFVICHLDARRFAIPAADVREVHQAVTVTPLSGAPQAIIGLVDVRGRLVPVLGLRARLGLQPHGVTPSDALVRVQLREGRQLLLLVDRVSDVEEIPAEVREDAEEVVPGAKYVREIGRDHAGPIVVNDLDTFLSAEELADLDAALDRYDRSPGTQP